MTDAAPPSPLDVLNRDMKDCVRCHLAEGRLQVVPGEGPDGARVALIGHGPGGTDDETGHPYSGPGGDLLDQLLAQAGVARGRLYITNMVKCWPWKVEHGQRINRTPNAGEVKACEPIWLGRELEALRPAGIVCLGTTAAQHFLGKGFKITQGAGRWLPLPPDSPFLKVSGAHLDPAPPVMAIMQPAYLIHLAQHVPDAYDGAKTEMLRALARVKAVVDGAEPDVEAPENPAPVS
ncbi:MAG TPA: uracil-DNA glycosylase [Deinococcales bacterium]|nr:uracil-DNA glycosylase [Deinococcales bacterium]